MHIKNLLCMGTQLLFKLFPLKKRIVLFSYSGTKSADSPYQIYKYIAKKYPLTKTVWLSDKQECEKAYIKYNSLKGLFYRKTSQVIVENVFCDSVFFIDNKCSRKRAEFKSLLNKRRGQKLVTTWHGTPLKKMGRDQVGNTVEDCIACGKIYFILGNTHTAKIMKHLVFGRAETKLFGSPRNDILVNITKENVIENHKVLCLPQNKKIILYAPTFRSNSDMSIKYIDDSGIFQMNILDFDRLFEVLKERFGGEWIMVCRFHYHVADMVDWNWLEEKYPNRFINGNQHEEIADYLLCSDVLITDYSSCMFDYAILNRPVFLFCHDLEHYGNEERGFYMDIDKLPFPLAEDFDVLYDNIKNFDNQIYCKKLEEMKKQMGYCEEGNATERAGDFIYGLLEDD